MKNEDNMEIFEQMMLMISKDFIFDVIKSEFNDKHFPIVILLH